MSEHHTELVLKPPGEYQIEGYTMTFVHHTCTAICHDCGWESNLYFNYPDNWLTVEEEAKAHREAMQ